jgi:pimeloyl-ACP methyl ester carboxylesterase
VSETLRIQYRRRSKQGYAKRRPAEKRRSKPDLFGIEIETQLNSQKFIQSAIRFSYYDTNGVKLHVAEAGPTGGPLVVLLHGFPEFWYGWRHQIDDLAQAGYRVIVPDQRGYNKSDKPQGRAAYSLDQLADDIIGLVEITGAESFALIGHDWGAAVGWWIASQYKTTLQRFVALAAPHPFVWIDAIQKFPDQRKKSWYIQAFRLPYLPEFILRWQDFKSMSAAMKETKRPEACTEHDLVQYRQAWSEPGALTGMLNWYRAIYLKRVSPVLKNPIEVHTKILWGNDDKYGIQQLAEMSCQLCSKGSVEYLNTTHWIQHDAPDRVNQSILDFLDDWNGSI